MTQAWHDTEDARIGSGWGTVWSDRLRHHLNDTRGTEPWERSNDWWLGGFISPGCLARLHLALAHSFTDSMSMLKPPSAYFPDAYGIRRTSTTDLGVVNEEADAWTWQDAEGTRF